MAASRASPAIMTRDIRLASYAQQQLQFGPNLFFLPNGNTLGNPGGVVGGAQVGYNFQFNQFLIGAETDFQGTSLSGGGNNSPLTLFPSPYGGANNYLTPIGAITGANVSLPVVRHRARPRRLPFHADLAALRHGGLRLWAGGRL